MVKFYVPRALTMPALDVMVPPVELVLMQSEMAVMGWVPLKRGKSFCWCS